MSKTLNKVVIVLYILTTLLAQLYTVSATAGVPVHNSASMTSQMGTNTNMSAFCDSSMSEDCAVMMHAQSSACCDVDCASMQCSAAYPMTSFDFSLPYRTFSSTLYVCAALSQTTSLLYRPPITLVL